MNRPILTVAAVTAVAVLAVGGLGVLSRQSGVVALPTPSATAAPAATPTAAPTATPVRTPFPVREGSMPAGTYAAHPLPAPMTALAVTLTLPDGWAAMVDGGSVLAPSDEPHTEPPGGMAIQLLDVTSVNRDACHWKGQDDDIDLGPTVDDLVRALRQQTALQASDPVDVTLGGYSGKRVDLVAPTTPYVDPSATGAPSCDDGLMQPWSSAGFGAEGIHLQGPANRWQANILDVDGTRLVVVAQDFPGTSASDRAELDAILGSIVIEP